ncbi:MAG: hypothetical protein L0Y56_15355, partial [Nitrospira sp.]|nr:hypothetical protein [Nitrospira sp.]
SLAWTLGGCKTPVDPGIEGVLGFNVQPYPGSALSVQMQALNEIRANWIRVTLGILTDAAGPYVTATPANVLGLIADFNLGPINKSDWPDRVETVIRRYPSIQYFEILNEPAVFNGISNRDYVRDYLKPAHDRIRSRFPSIKIVAAAPIGQPSGIGDFTEMSLAGADDYCDFRAVHIYFQNGLVNPWTSFQRATRKPIMVTETGINQPSQHLNWWNNQIPEMKRVFTTDLVFYYVLLEQPFMGFGIITGQLDSNGQVIPTPESGLYNFLRGST